MTGETPRVKEGLSCLLAPGCCLALATDRRQPDERSRYVVRLQHGMMSQCNSECQGTQSVPAGMDILGTPFRHLLRCWPNREPLLCPCHHLLSPLRSMQQPQASDVVRRCSSAQCVHMHVCAGCRSSCYLTQCRSQEEEGWFPLFIRLASTLQAH